MEPAALAALADPAQATQAAAASPMESMGSPISPHADFKPYAISGGVAIIPLTGVLTKYRDVFCALRRHLHAGNAGDFRSGCR
jgi:hypothetical protein